MAEEQQHHSFESRISLAVAAASIGQRSDLPPVQLSPAARASEDAAAAAYVTGIAAAPSRPLAPYMVTSPPYTFQPTPVRDHEAVPEPVRAPRETANVSPDAQLWVRGVNVKAPDTALPDGGVEAQLAGQAQVLYTHPSMNLPRRATSSRVPPQRRHALAFDIGQEWIPTHLMPHPSFTGAEQVLDHVHNGFMGPRRRPGGKSGGKSGGKGKLEGSSADAGGATSGAGVADAGAGAGAGAADTTGGGVAGAGASGDAVTGAHAGGGGADGSMPPAAGDAEVAQEAAGVTQCPIQVRAGWLGQCVVVPWMCVQGTARVFGCLNALCRGACVARCTRCTHGRRGIWLFLRGHTPGTCRHGGGWEDRICSGVCLANKEFIPRRPVLDARGAGSAGLAAWVP